MTSLLEIRGLSVRLRLADGNLSVLDRVNITVPRGRIIGVVGESGCGKTTLARAILGALPPVVAEVTNGAIVFDGVNLLTLRREVLRRDILGRRICLIPQDPSTAFHPMFTVGAQISDLVRQKGVGAPSPLRWFRGPDAHARQEIIEAIRAVRIPDPESALQKLPGRLSGGQLQRMMIAMALLPKPDLIVADEPTTALDVTVQAQVLRLLRNLVTQRGLSMILTTHDLGVAYEICDEIVVMYAGQDMEHAPTSAFFESPRHPYTRHLLESLPQRGGRWTKDTPKDPVLPNPNTQGCRYHPRCRFVDARCLAAQPTLEPVESGHSVRCFNHERVEASSIEGAKPLVPVLRESPAS